MLGLVDAVDALIALDPPGLREPAPEPRRSSEEAHAARQRRRDTLRARGPLPPPAPPRSGPARRRQPPVFEVPLASVEAIARGPRRAASPGLAALVAALLASGAGLLGRGLLLEPAAARLAEVRGAPGQALPALSAAPPLAAPPEVPPPAAPAAGRAPSLLPGATREGPVGALPARAWAAPDPAPSAGPLLPPAPPTGGVLELVELLRDPGADAASRAAAAQALGASALPEHERALDDTALSADPVGRALALEQLARRGRLSIQAQIAVERALADPDGAVRAAAARAMVAVPQAASRLIPRLPRERDPVVLQACFEALAQTAGPEHLATLELHARRLPSAARALAVACERNGVPLPERDPAAR